MHALVSDRTARAACIPGCCRLVHHPASSGSGTDMWCGPAAGAHGGLQVGPGAGGAGLELPADPVKGVAPCCPVITRGRGGPRRSDVQWRRRTASGTCTSAATITWRSPPAAETVRGRRRRARSKAAADGRALVVHTHIHTHKRATLRCD